MPRLMALAVDTVVGLSRVRVDVASTMETASCIAFVFTMTCCRHSLLAARSTGTPARTHGMAFLLIATLRQTFSGCCACSGRRRSLGRLGPDCCAAGPAARQVLDVAVLGERRSATRCATLAISLRIVRRSVSCGLSSALRTTFPWFSGPRSQCGNTVVSLPARIMFLVATRPSPAFSHTGSDTSPSGKRERLGAVHCGQGFTDFPSVS